MQSKLINFNMIKMKNNKFENKFNKSKLRKKLRKNRMSKKQKDILKKMFISLLGLIFICVLIIVINKAKVLRVELIGLNFLNPIDIIEDAGLSKYNNRSFFSIPKKEIKNEIEKNIRLEVENIKLSFPDLLIINLREKETLFLLEADTGIYEVTDEGDILKNDVIYNYDVPYITGLTVSSTVSDTNAEIENDYTQYLISIIYEVKKNNRDIYNLISEINAFGKDLILYPRGYPVQIILEKYVKASKFVELAAVLKTVREQASKTYRIDFRFDEAITVN